MNISDENRRLIKAREKGIDKVGIVVSDAVKTARRYSQMLCLGPWSFYDLDPTLTVLQDTAVQDVRFGVRIAANTLGDKRIELIQPLYGPSTYMTFLQERGEGIHHLSFGVTDEYDQIVVALRARGISVEMQGIVSGGQAFTHFGSRAGLGISFEVAEPATAETEPWGTYEPQEPGWIDTDGKRIGQIGIITKDAETMARRYWEIFGIGPWYLFDFKPPVAGATMFHGIPVKEGIVTFIRAAIADHPNLQFELIQPVAGPGTHMEFLRRQGVGAHHLSFDIINDYDDVAATFEAQGVEVEMSGLAGDAYLYTYWATQQDLGTLFEAVKFFPEEDETAGLYGVYPPERLEA